MKAKYASFLACPACGGTIVPEGASKLRCTACAKLYPIIRGIPVFIETGTLSDHAHGQIAYFSEKTKIYDSLQPVESPWQKKYLDRFFRNIPKPSGKLIIDDACGSGYVSVESAKRGAFVIACDINMAALIRLAGIAKQLKLDSRILPVCCTAEALPLQKNVADGIVANAILEHLPREGEAIASMSRVIKKGGIAMVTVPLAYSLVNPLLLPVHYILDKRIGHLRRYTQEMLVARFSGWKALDVLYTGHTRKVMKTLINVLAPVFDPQEIEKEDDRLAGKKRFASNISILFRKKS